MEMETATRQDEFKPRTSEQELPQSTESTKILSGINRRLTEYIKANPGPCLLGAIVTGYVIGRLVRRR